MKKIFGVLLCLVILLSTTVTYADSAYRTELSLCCAEDVFAVDYVLSVVDGAEITDIQIADENCYPAWHYSRSEALLRISLAATEPIPKVKSLVTIISDAPISLTPVSLKINETAADLSCLSHSDAIRVPAVAPTCDKPGRKEAEKCSVCGAILTDGDLTIPPTGPVITATLANSTLTVTGKLSDDASTENTVFLGIYRDDGMLLRCVDISGFAQNNLHLTCGNMQEADHVKLFRLSSVALRPSCSALRFSISK